MAEAFDIASVVRFHIRDAQVFDHSNDTVVVTRTLLRKAADEIDRLRARNAELERGVLLWKEQADFLAGSLNIHYPIVGEK